MRRGEGLLSTFIVNKLNDSINISHCGIIIREGEEIDVIHCLSDKVSDVNGVQKCTIDEFTRESIRGSISVVRCMADTSGVLANGAQYYLKVRKKFDHNFDINDTTEFFCSELPLHILSNRLGVNVLDKNQEFKFSMFFKPQLFKTILVKDSVLPIKSINQIRNR